MSGAHQRPAGGERLRDNLAGIEQRVADACRRAGRDRETVRIVAVTKYVDAGLTQLVVEAGCRDLAESRPQALWAKAAALAGLGPAPRWHLVGHLQRNKVRRTLPLLQLVHSLDGSRLLATLEAEAAALGRGIEALVEINLTGDHGRTGLAPEAAAALLAEAGACPHVDVRGLMGMAPVPDGDPAAARRAFAQLRDLRDQLATACGRRLPELSMGMSGDFEEAILEGATLVRIGSALFEGLT